MQTDYKQPKLGCSVITNSTDSDSSPNDTNIEADSCKMACTKNYSCKTVFFQLRDLCPHCDCYYVSKVFSLMNLNLQNTSTVYIKVQNLVTLNNGSEVSPNQTEAPTGKRSRFLMIRGYCFASFFALIITPFIDLIIPKQGSFLFDYTDPSERIRLVFRPSAYQKWIIYIYQKIDQFSNYYLK